MKFKVMEYNILNGLCTEMPPYRLEQSRLNQVAQIIEEQKPDILILCEAYFWPFAKKQSLQDMKKVFKEIYTLYAPADTEFRYGQVVLSRFPIKKQKILSDYLLNLLRVELDVQGKTVTLDVFHPHPDTTEEERKQFLKRKLFTGKHYIFAGDFNALSHEDTHDKERLIKGYEAFMGVEAKSKITDLLTSKTTKLLTAKGLRDSYKQKPDQCDYTVPTGYRKNSENSRSRIDFIFHSQEFKTLDSGIIQTKHTDTASDHHPIFAVFEL